jgi:hypothetical protein
MALSNFLSKLNWRLMLVHFIAYWFIYHGTRQLAYLYDYDFLEKLANNYYNLKNHYRGFDGNRLSMDLLYVGYASFVGLLAAILISLIVSIKHKWSWLNSVIVLLMAFTVCLFNRFYWHHIRIIFQAPGSIFKSDWAFILTNGLMMLAVGLCLFFWKGITRFIDGAKTRTVEAV